MRTKKSAKEEPAKENAPIENTNENQAGATSAKPKKTTTAKRTTARKSPAAKKQAAPAAAEKPTKKAVTKNTETEAGEAAAVAPSAAAPSVAAPSAASSNAAASSVAAPSTAATETTEAKQALPIPTLPDIKINDIIDLAQAPQRAIILTDQQIQQLTLEEIDKRYKFLEESLASVLDYDIVISDTNIWLELLVGHSSSHSDPRVNARLQFERQLEFVSKLMKHRGGKFIIMGETYEEIDRFAAMQDPTNHKEADFTDNIVCLNAAARLAKRLILAQQRENRLRIEGISAESHHASFADPAIVHRVVELFAEGKKVLLITNDASVAIRSIGLCDDLQRINNISDDEWNSKYATLRPMVFTFDDLRLLDYYTRQLYYLQMAAKKSWMEDVAKLPQRIEVDKLTLWQEAFRPGDKHRGDNLFIGAEPENVTSQQQKQKQQKQRLQKKQDVAAKKDATAKKDMTAKKDVVVKKESIAKQESAPKADAQPAEAQKAETADKTPATESAAPAQTDTKTKKPRRRPSRAKKKE